MVIYQATKIVALALYHFGGAVAGVFAKVWDVFVKFYARVLKPFVEWSWRYIQKLHTWLKDTFGPLLKFLDAVRADILNIYNKWLRPILTTIDVLRQTMHVLATLHVPFAQKVDDALAALERRLLLPIRLALQKINELANWVNRIIDFDGYFQRFTLIASAWRYERDLWRNWWGSVSRREAERPKAPPAAVEQRTSISAAREVRDLVVNHDESRNALASEYAKTLRLYVQQRRALFP